MSAPSGTNTLCCMHPACSQQAVLLCEPCRFCMCLNHVVLHCASNAVAHTPLRCIAEEGKIGLLPTGEDGKGLGLDTSAGEPYDTVDVSDSVRKIPHLTVDPLNTVGQTEEVGPDHPLRQPSSSGLSGGVSAGFSSSFIPQYAPFSAPMFTTTGATAADVFFDALANPFTAGFTLPVAAFTAPSSATHLQAEDLVPAATATTAVVPAAPTKAPPSPDSPPSKVPRQTNKRKARTTEQSLPPTACGCPRHSPQSSFASQDRDHKIERVNKRSEAYVACDRGILVLPLRTKGDTKYYIACRDLPPAGFGYSVQFRFNISHVKDPKIADPNLVHDLVVNNTHYWVIDAPIVSPVEAKSSRAVVGLHLMYCFKGTKMMLRSSHAKKLKVHDRDYKRLDENAFQLEVWFKRPADESYQPYHSFAVFRQKQKPVSQSQQKRQRFAAVPNASENGDAESQIEEKFEMSDGEASEAQASTAAPSTALEGPQSTPTASASSTNGGSPREIVTVKPDPKEIVMADASSSPLPAVGGDQGSERSTPSLAAVAGDVANLQIADQRLRLPPLRDDAAATSAAAPPAQIASLHFPAASAAEHKTAADVPRLSYPPVNFSSVCLPLPFAGAAGVPPPMPSMATLPPPIAPTAAPFLREALFNRPDLRNMPEYTFLAQLQVVGMAFYLHRSVLEHVNDVKMVDGGAPNTPPSVRITPVVVGTWRNPNHVAEFRVVSSDGVHPGHAALVVEYEAEGYTLCQQRLLMNFDNTSATFYMPGDIALKIASCSRRAFAQNDAIVRFFVDRYEIFRFCFNVNWAVAQAPVALGRGGPVIGFGGNDPSNRQFGSGDGGYGGGGSGSGLGGSGYGQLFGGNNSFGSGGVGGRQFSQNGGGIFNNVVVSMAPNTIVWDGELRQCALCFRFSPRFTDKAVTLPSLDQLRTLVLQCPSEAGTLKLRPSVAHSNELTVTFLIRPELQYRYWPRAYENERAVIVPFQLGFGSNTTLIKSTFAIVCSGEDAPAQTAEMANLTYCLVDLAPEMSALTEAQADLCESALTRCATSEGSPVLFCHFMREGQYQSAILAAVSAAVVGAAKPTPANSPLPAEATELARLLGPLSRDEDADFTAEGSEAGPARAAASATPAPARAADAASASGVDLTARQDAGQLVYDLPNQSVVFTIQSSSTSATLSDLQASLQAADVSLKFLTEAGRVVAVHPSNISFHATVPGSATLSFSFSVTDQHEHWPNAYADERPMITACSLTHKQATLLKSSFSFRADGDEASASGDGRPTRCLVDITQELSLVSPSDASAIETVMCMHSNGKFGSSPRLMQMLSDGEYSQAILQALVDAVFTAASAGAPAASAAEAEPAHSSPALREYIRLLDVYLTAMASLFGLTPAAPEPEDAVADVMRSLSVNSGVSDGTPSPSHSPVPPSAAAAKPASRAPTPPRPVAASDLSANPRAPTPQQQQPPRTTTPLQQTRATTPPQQQPQPQNKLAPRAPQQAQNSSSAADVLALITAVMASRGMSIPNPTNCAQEVARPSGRGDVLNWINPAVRGVTSASPASSAASAAAGSAASAASATTPVPSGLSTPAQQQLHPASTMAQFVSSLSYSHPSPNAHVHTMSIPCQISNPVGPSGSRDFPPLPGNMMLADCLRAFNELCSQLYYAHTPADIPHLRQAYGRLSSLANVVRDHYLRNRSPEAKRLYMEMFDYAKQLNERLELLAGLAQE